MTTALPNHPDFEAKHTPYTALSYVWGQGYERALASVQIRDGKTKKRTINVTLSLKSALEAIFPPQKAPSSFVHLD